MKIKQTSTGKWGLHRQKLINKAKNIDFYLNILNKFY